MKCIACDNLVEDHCIDTENELCNKCYGHYLKASQELEEYDSFITNFNEFLDENE